MNQRRTLCRLPACLTNYFVMDRELRILQDPSHDSPHRPDTQASGTAGPIMQACPIFAASSLK